MRYAIIVDGVVDNICEWDGITPWAPVNPSSIVMQTDEAGPGDLWNGKVFSKTVPAVTKIVVASKPSLADRVAALEQQIALLQAPVK